MLGIMKAAGGVGAILALVVLLVALVKKLIALVTLLIVVLKVGIVVAFAGVVVVIVLAMLRERGRRRRESGEF